MASCNTCGRSFQDTKAVKDHQHSTGHCYCLHCSQPFPHEQAFAEHKRVYHTHTCGICNKSWEFRRHLQDHQRSTVHGYCHNCDKYFASKESLMQHRRALHEHHCGQCSSVFASIIQLQNHQRSKGHCYCCECDRFFGSQEAQAQHLRSTIHVSQYRCVECERDFSSEQALQQHLIDKKTHGPSQHSIAPLDDGTYTCDKCDRDFPDHKALKQHLESVVHRPLNQLRCIASTKCKRRFTSPSALLHHLESGACDSGLTRASLNNLIRSHDTGNMITFGTQLGTLPDSDADDWNSSGLSSPGLLTPSSHDSDTYSGFMGSCLTPLDLPADYFVRNTAQSLVNRAGKLLCPLCPASSRGFRTMQALENHLASPAHAPKIFHCPVNVMSSEKEEKQTEALIKEFSTLSGLTQHVESGACDGGRKMLEGAMEFVQEKLNELGFRDVKLLK
ncbi:MAG: hypothetical protein Q9213_008273 [Squamulea squamosa]